MSCLIKVNAACALCLVCTLSHSTLLQIVVLAVSQLFLCMQIFNVMCIVAWIYICHHDVETNIVPGNQHKSSFPGPARRPAKAARKGNKSARKGSESMPSVGVQAAQV